MPHSRSRGGGCCRGQGSQAHRDNTSRGCRERATVIVNLAEMEPAVDREMQQQVGRLKGEARYFLRKGRSQFAGTETLEGIQNGLLSRGDVRQESEASTGRTVELYLAVPLVTRATENPTDEMLEIPAEMPGKHAAGVGQLR